MENLITFVGNRDPFVEDTYDGLDTDGPVLTLLKERKYDRIFLFSNKNVALNAHQLQEEIKKRKLCGQIENVYLEIIDPTSYDELLPLIWTKTSEIQDRCEKEDGFDIATSSGTPQMHATWMLLRQGGKIRGHLLKITPPKFLKKGAPTVSEIPDLPFLGGPMKSFRGEPAPGNELAIQNLGLKRTLEGIRGSDDFIDVIGHDGSLKALFAQLENVSDEDITVLIGGETGTGKELIARCIHRISPRRSGPFITVNCGAIPENLVESTLFGHKKGAFTGASTDQVGEISKAEGGTLFLDEIGDLPPGQQVKFLRFLQDGEIHVLGGGTRRVNARVIAASNKNLREEVKKGRFREDLFYRLNGFPVQLPPLRERLQDLPELVEFFMVSLNQGRKEPKKMDPAVLKAFQSYHWPGNIRELENIVRRMYHSAAGRVIGLSELPEEVLQRECAKLDIVVPSEGLDLPARLRAIEKEYYLSALRVTSGNKAKAARLLGIDPKAFQKACRERFGI
jgi:DNA-binding NtrC family response regulator